jgi:DNA-binding transcriptional MerR regulator
MNISEVAAKTELTPVTLRYYEKIGLISAIKRKNGGVRDYSEADIEWIDFIKCMRSAGLSIESLIHYTALYNQGSETIAERKDLLMAERAQLEKKYQEIGETLEKLNRKIARYDNINELTPTK